MANITSFAIQTRHSISTNFKLKNVPHHHPDLYPTWHIGLPITPLPIPDDSYYPISNAPELSATLATNFLQAEADILTRTLLEQSQHPKIGPSRFLRCILLDDLVNGLCLKHYTRTLADAIPYRSHGDISPVVIPFEPRFVQTSRDVDERAEVFYGSMG